MFFQFLASALVLALTLGCASSPDVPAGNLTVGDDGSAGADSALQDGTTPGEVGDGGTVDGGWTPGDAAGEDAATSDLPEAGATYPVASPDFKLGFVGTVTGKVHVVDLASMTDLTNFGGGHHNVHGVGPLPGQKVVWYGNSDTPSLEKYEMQNGDPSQWLLTKTVKASTTHSVLHISRSGNLIATADGSVKLDGSFQKVDPETTGKHVALFDTKTEAYRGIIPVSTSFGVVVSDDGSLVYAGNWVENTITVIDANAVEVKDIWSLPMPKGTEWFGPSGLVLSRDGKQLAAGGWDGKVIHLLDTKSGAAVAVPTDGYAHWGAYSADDKTMYFSVFSKLPVQGDELANVSVPSHVLVVDRATLKPLAKVEWSHFLGHVGIPEGSSSLLVTGAFGTLLRYDTATLQLTGQVQLYNGLPMPASIVSF